MDKKQPKKAQQATEQAIEQATEAQQVKEAQQATPAENTPIKEETIENLNKVLTPEFMKAVQPLAKMASQWQQLQKNFVSLYKPILQSMREYITSDEFRQVIEFATDLQQNAEELKEQLSDIITFHDLFLEEIKKPEYEGLTADELHLLAEDPAADPKYRKLWEQARKNTREKADAQAQQEAEAAAQLPTVTYTKKPGIELTTAKLSNIFFGPNAPKPQGKDINGQMSFIPLKYERDGAATEITLFYNYYFDEDALKKVGLPKSVDDQDYFILSHIWDNYAAGNKLLTVTKLYKDMTGDDPNDREKTELTNRLIRLATTSIFINDKEVSKAWNLPTYNERVTRLAPIEIGIKRFTANGKIAEGGFLIHEPPAIMQLSYEMGQYTTVPKALLHVKKKNGRRVSRTKRFYRILHFLIRRIAAIKSGKLSGKILYKTFFAEVGETKTTSGQRAALKTMFDILDHFKACEWINGYREETTKSTGEVGVRIYTNADKKKITGKSTRKNSKSR